MLSEIEQIEYYNQFRKYLDEENAEEAAAMIEQKDFEINDWQGVLQMEMQDIPFKHMVLFENDRFKDAWINYIDFADFFDMGYMFAKIISNIINKTEDYIKLVSLILDEKISSSFINLISSIIETAEYLCADDILLLIADSVCENSQIYESINIVENIYEVCYKRKLTSAAEKILDVYHQQLFQDICNFKDLHTAVNILEICNPNYVEEDVAELVGNFCEHRIFDHMFLEEQYDFIFSLGIKTSVLNNIIPLLLFDCNFEKQLQIIDLLNDDVVVYVAKMSLNHLNKFTEIIPFLQLKNKKISINIDDNDGVFSSFMVINNSNVKKIFSTYKIALTCPFVDNMYLNYFAKNNSELLYVILDNLDYDDEIMSDIVTICANNKNIKALDYIVGMNQKKETYK